MKKTAKKAAALCLMLAICVSMSFASAAQAASPHLDEVVRLFMAVAGKASLSEEEVKMYDYDLDGKIELGDAINGFRLLADKTSLTEISLQNVLNKYSALENVEVVKPSSAQSAPTGIIEGFSTVDSFEKNFFQRSWAANVYAVVKGEKVSSTSYYKDFGEVTGETNGREWSCHDIRYFTITKIKITEIYSQEVHAESGCKVGDVIEINEYFSFYFPNGKPENVPCDFFPGYHISPVGEGEYLFYIQKPKEDIRVGNVSDSYFVENGLYDTLPGVWSLFEAFSVETHQPRFPYSTMFINDEIVGKYVK